MHPAQKQLLDLLNSQSIENLTLTEIGQRIGIEQRQLVSHHLKQLERKGYIKKEQNTNTYIPLTNPLTANIVLPIYGMAQCGHQDRINNNYNVEKVELPTKILNIKSVEGLFLVRAEGLSMSPEIKEGDLVLVKKQEEKDIENQTCLVIDDGTAKIKKVLNTVNEHVLISTNPNFSPKIAGEDFRILGVVKNVIGNID